jgi:hypothetical protein
MTFVIVISAMSLISFLTVLSVFDVRGPRYVSSGESDLHDRLDDCDVPEGLNERDVIVYP